MNRQLPVRHWRLPAVCLLAQFLLASCTVGAAEPLPTLYARRPLESAVPTAVSTSTSTGGPAVVPTAAASPSPDLPGPVLSAGTMDGRTVAVSVENEMPARPQAGLADADVIYEAVAEWDLTRFVAVFTDSSPETVGPVRSGRDYQAAIAAEYEAAFADCLSVPSVAQVVAATKVVNLDGCRVLDPQGFWRDWDRRMPHNLFVNVPTLRKVAGGRGTYGGFSNRQAWGPAASPAGSLSFVYPEDHLVKWKYDAERREYLRWQDGEPHVDRAGTQLSSKAVILQFVQVRDTTYYGERGYHDLTLVGEGKATIYANGDKREALWKRPTLAEPTRYFAAAGQELRLPPGRIFVQLVKTGTVIDES